MSEQTNTPQSTVTDLGGGVMQVSVRSAPKDTTPDQTTIPTRPENVEEKFWDAEKGQLKTDALLKSYHELQRAFSQRSQQTTQEPPKPASPSEEKPKEGEQPKGEEAKTDDQAAKDAVENAGLDFDSVRSEYADKGQLTDETYAKLEKGGIPRSMVDAYIAGQEARAREFEGVVHAAAGGKDTHDAMVAWAQTNLSRGEIIAYNAAMQDIINIEAGKAAAAGLAARYALAMGQPPKVTIGGSSVPSGDIYESRAQLVTDIRDPRYQKDPAFRAAVKAKVARSNLPT